ncbi:MAG: helix-turn-helix domain-containing protein [Desulfovibrio sp.]|nr:helix-turn-helix domain-containing protein [Desulfovibrio sp.]
MPDYRNMTAVEALRHAKELSGLTAAEIAEASGLGTASVTRYFRQDGEYSPGLESIPKLCRAMGNTVLVDWLLAQTGRDAPVEPAKSRAEVLTSVALAAAALGDASRILADTERGGIDAAKAREIRAALEDVKDVCAHVQGQLQKLASSKPGEYRVLYQSAAPRN